MVSYYNPLSYGQCANLYPNTGYWNNLPAYQQTAANAASAATLFGGGNAIHNNGVPFGSQTGGGGGGGVGGTGGGSVGSGGGGSPDSEGQSPMYYAQHYQHAMFQQGSPEWHAGDRAGSPPSSALSANRAQANRGFPYPAIGAQNPHHQHKMGNMMMGSATDLRTNLNMDKMGHISALPSPPISSPGGNCQTTKAGNYPSPFAYPPAPPLSTPSVRLPRMCRGLSSAILVRFCAPNYYGTQYEVIEGLILWVYDTHGPINIIMLSNCV